MPLSSNFHCCCWKAWSYSDPYPFSLVIYKIFFVPWFWNFIIYLGIDLFSPMILDIQRTLLTRKLLFSSSQIFFHCINDFFLSMLFRIIWILEDNLDQSSKISFTPIFTLSFALFSGWFSQLYFLTFLFLYVLLCILFLRKTLLFSWCVLLKTQYMVIVLLM